MGDPKLCVITPSLNQRPFIERTLRSVLDEDIDGLDYVVVDGGSDDGTLEILRRYEDRLRWSSEPDEGQADAVNKGLARTEGEIIGWLNSDDVYYPGALETVRAWFAENPEADVLYGNGDHIDEQDSVLEPYPCEPWNAERLIEVCFLCQPAVFFRRRVVERCGPLDTRLRYCLDYEYWLRCSGRGMRFEYLPETLAGSRLYPGNKTLGERLAVHAETNDMLRRALGRVPDRWLYNYAHVQLEERGMRRERHRRRFAVAVSLRSWLAALRWNRRLSRSMLETTWEWIRDAQTAAAGPTASPSPQPHPEDRHRRRWAGTGRRRIGIDVSQTGQGKAGCGYMADSLVQALAAVDRDNRYILYGSFGDTYWDPRGPEATRHIEAPNFERGASHTTHGEARAFWSQPPEDLEDWLGQPDLVHSNNFFCPSLPHARLVYTLHDLAILTHPEWSTEENRLICFDGVFNASLHADLLLAVSESTRRQFLDNYPHYPVERTVVVPLASRFADRAPVEPTAAVRELAGRPFLLSVGTLEPRKNHGRLLRAYAGWLADCREPMPLVLAGGRGWLMERIDRVLEEPGLQPFVHRLGYVDDATLKWLYQNCYAFLYPSLLEGFGLPVVEALSQGAAVLTSSTSSLPEVAGEAALLVEPTEVGEIEEGIRRLTRDEGLRRELRHKAIHQAARFSWRRTAERVLRCYRQVMEMPKYTTLPGSSRRERPELPRVSR